MTFDVIEYNLSTAHRETVQSVPGTMEGLIGAGATRQMAEAAMEHLAAQDTSSDHAYYVQER